MKVQEQCGTAASKGTQIMGIIRKTIIYKDKQLCVPLYKSIVKPHFEFFYASVEAISQEGHRQARKKTTKVN